MLCDHLALVIPTAEKNKELRYGSFKLPKVVRHLFLGENSVILNLKRAEAAVCQTGQASPGMPGASDDAEGEQLVFSAAVVRAHVRFCCILLNMSSA